MLQLFCVTLWLFFIAFLSHSIFITKDDHILKAVPYSLWERLHKNEKDEEPKVPPPNSRVCLLRRQAFQLQATFWCQSTGRCILCSEGLGQFCLFTLQIILLRDKPGLGAWLSGKSTCLESRRPWIWFPRTHSQRMQVEHTQQS